MLLWSAQAISQTAQNAIWFALMVLIEEATQSTTQVGIAIISFVLPSVLFTVPAGVLVDRVDKRLVLVSTNWLRAIVVLGYLIFSASVSAIYAVTFVFSIISQFFLPAESSMIPALVGRRRLMTANSLFNLTFTISQLVGIVLLAPVVIKLFGQNTLFLMIAVLFAVCGFLVLPLPSHRGHMPVPGEQPEEHPFRRFFGDVHDAFLFLRGDKLAAMAMVVLTVGATLSLITAMIAPRFVVAVLGIRADDTVYVLAPAGLGMAIGAVAVGRLNRWLPKELLVVVGGLGVGVGLLLLAVVSPLWNLLFHGLLSMAVDPENHPKIVSLVSMVGLVAGVMGVALSMMLIPSQTMLQEQAPAPSRGRIFAVQIMLGNLASVLPLLFVGGLADLLGVSVVLIGLAAGMFVLGYFAFRTFRGRIWGPPTAGALPPS